MVHLHFSFPFLILHFINDFKMKSIVYNLCLFLVSLQGFAQVNLVPNPSFEDYTQCPTGFDQIDRATGWSSYANSPDYIQSCTSGPLSVPSNSFGYQSAKEGSAYSFIFTYDTQFLPFVYREYIGIRLNDELVVGTRYFVSAFVSRPDSISASGASNHLGFRFLNSASSVFVPFSPDNFAHVQCDSIITDQQNWVQLFGSFIADTAFQFLAIGNFYDNIHTDTINFQGTDGGYYIDAVCVSTDSLYALAWTSIHENAIPSQIEFMVNGDQIVFLNLTREELISVYDLTGKEVFRGKFSSANNKLDFSLFAQGMYLIETENFAASKLLIFH